MRSGLAVALHWEWRRLSADSLRQCNYVWWFSSRCLRRHGAKRHAEDGRATLPTHLTLTSEWNQMPYTHKHKNTLVWKVTGATLTLQASLHISDFCSGWIMTIRIHSRKWPIYITDPYLSHENAPVPLRCPACCTTMCIFIIEANEIHIIANNLLYNKNVYEATMNVIWYKNPYCDSTLYNVVQRNMVLCSLIW